MGAGYRQYSDIVTRYPAEKARPEEELIAPFGLFMDNDDSSPSPLYLQITIFSRTCCCAASALGSVMLM